MGLFSKGKRNSSNMMLDDITFIGDMQHIRGPWQQYDFLLAAQGYGWGYMVDSAEYMIHAELEKIGTVSSSKGAGESIEYIEEFRASGESVKAMPSLREEAGTLGIGGMSKTLGGQPLKIIWINQSNVLRIITPVDDENKMIRYAETVVRRSFGTKDAMKMGQPIPKEDIPEEDEKE